MATKSNYYFGQITDIQSDVAGAIARIYRTYDLGNRQEVSTDKGQYVVTVNAPGSKFRLTIDDGMDKYSETTLNPLELVCILEALESKYNAYS